MPNQQNMSNRYLERIKLPYLTMAQQIIARMANYSATLKVCCSTIVAGMFVFLSSGRAVSAHSWPLIIPFFVVVLFFAYFDAKYLQQERCYRFVYSQIQEAEDDNFDRSMKMPAPKDVPKNSLGECFSSWSVGLFYVLMVVGIAVAFFAIAFVK